MAIKIGNKIVQKDGGGYRPQGYNKSSNNSIKKVNSGNDLSLIHI